MAVTKTADNIYKLKHIQRLVPPSCSLPRIDSKKQCPVHCTPIHHKMDPTSGDRCFVDEVLEPVQLRDVVVDDTPHIRSQSFRDTESLEAYLQDGTNQNYSCRFMLDSPQWLAISSLCGCGVG